MIARLSALACALFVTAASASAAPITTLFSTGQGNAGEADPHYTLTSAPRRVHYRLRRERERAIPVRRVLGAEQLLAGRRAGIRVDRPPPRTST
jgi:hypothetical protein